MTARLPACFLVCPLRLTAGLALAAAVGSAGGCSTAETRGAASGPDAPAADAGACSAIAVRDQAPLAPTAAPAWSKTATGAPGESLWSPTPAPLANTAASIPTAPSDSTARAEPSAAPRESVAWLHPTAAPPLPTPGQVRRVSGPVAPQAAATTTQAPSRVMFTAPARPASASGTDRLRDPGGDRLADVPASSAVVFWN